MLHKYCLVILLITLFNLQSCKNNNEISYEKPITYTEHKKEKRNTNPDKNAKWTPEQAAKHQKILVNLTKTRDLTYGKNASSSNSYANGALTGEWLNRGPKNMPGAFKFAEMLDGTDTMYAVSWNHYVGEFNSKSYIFKGTVYNPTTGTGGDDFELLTANWPNRYENLFAFNVNGNVRLVAHIENGPIYYSDNDGQTWTISNGLPGAITSSAINRQDNNTIYVTDNTSVYVSQDNGLNFTVLKNFGSSLSSHLYTPRYSVQTGANNLYLARSGSFFKLNDAKNDFNARASYTNNGHGQVAFSVGGDSRTLYVTEDRNYWVSTNEGLSWTQKFPTGNFYGDTTGKMDAGEFIAIHPENPSISVAGYAHPIISTDALNSTKTDESGWGFYQNGTNLSPSQYQDRIRFNYHPDFQSSHFFYNSSGDLFSARCSDGGVFVSYKEWSDFPNPGVGYDNNGYANAHFININVLNTINPLIYRKSLFTGINDTNHINYGTQDQGSQSIIPGTSGDVLEVYQAIGGDGPSIDSYDGINAWKWDRQGNRVFPPVKVYSNNSFLSIAQINSQFNPNRAINFNSSTDMGWVQTYIDQDDPDGRIWMLCKQLHRAEWNGFSLTGSTINKGNNQIAALTQAKDNPNKMYMLQDGKVFVSNNRGDSFGNAINTPFSMTTSARTRGDIGSGAVIPGNDNWILFCGPSTNNVGSILSKDGGNTWTDVTGIFPSGDDAQTGGMVVVPGGDFIFAGTDIGPYVFDVANETWYSLAEDIGFFNAMDVDYIAATNTVRFATWGSGVLDFTFERSALSTEDNVAFTDSNFKMYPNPASDFVMININDSKISRVDIDIFNVNGKLVSTNNYSISNKTPLKLNTNSLSTGVYIVKVKDKNKIIETEKLVIK